VSSSSPTEWSESSAWLELGSPAKLNLFLEVLDRREDGYHEIDSVFAEIDLCDRVRVKKAKRTTITVKGGDAPQDETNLAWRAADALGVGAEITLEKNIPAGAGLGGGSSNAACVLLALDALYDLELTEERLLGLATGLGADVPFFLQGGTARCRGIGERVEPLENPPRKRFVVVVPPQRSATPAVYRALGPGLTKNRENARVFVQKYCLEAVSETAPYFNRLQTTAERLEPGLIEVRRRAEELYGLPFTMSGTGSSYFAELREELRLDADRLEWGALGPMRVFVVETGSG